MRTPTARPGRRSPGRALAVPAVSYRRLAARGGQPVALARVMGAAPDLIELILADHERIRRLLRKDGDAAGYGEDPGCPGAQPWGGADAAMAGVHRVALDRGMRALFAGPLQIDPRWRPAPGPMEGGVLANLMVLTRAQTEAQLGPGAAGSEPQWMSDQRAGYRAQVHHGAEPISFQVGTAQPDAR